MRILLLPLLALAARLPAQLAWEREQIEVHCSVDQPRILTTFAFTNAGDDAIEVVETASSCGCATAALEKRAYGPGEQGEIDVVFDVGNRLGRQEKTITVGVRSQDSTEVVRTKLKLVVHIPQWVRASVRSLTWRAGDPQPTPRTVRVTVQHDEPIAVLSAVCADPAFGIVLRTVEAGRSYEVVVTPPAGGAVASTAIDITTDATVEKFRMLRIPVSVR